VEEVVSHRRLRWYGHVERKDKSGSLSACTKLRGQKVRGEAERRKKECAKLDLEWLRLVKKDVQNQDLFLGGEFRQLETIQHCLSAVMRLCSFTNCDVKGFTIMMRMFICKHVNIFHVRIIIYRDLVILASVL